MSQPSHQARQAQASPQSVNVEEGKSLIYIGATWCGPCKQIKPVFHNLEQQYGSKIKFYHLDLDQNRETAEQLGVNSVPSFFVVQEGNIIDKFTGANEQRLRSAVAKLASL